MRTLFPLLFVLAACSSGSPNVGGDAGGSGDSGNAGAQVRFSYDSTWAAHLGCTSLKSYQISFGAIPSPVDFTIDTTSGSLGQYQTVEGRTYNDADVLHTYTCTGAGSATQNYSLFGIDLPLSPAKRYTVTLSGSAATMVEDP